MVELSGPAGLHNLHGFSDDERVTRHFIETQPLNGILCAQHHSTGTQLALVLQLKSLGCDAAGPEHGDEAHHRASACTPTRSNNNSAFRCACQRKHGRGVPELKQTLADWLRRFPQPVQATAAVLSEDISSNTASTICSAAACTSRSACRPPAPTGSTGLLAHPWLGIPAVPVVMLGVFQAVTASARRCRRASWMLDQAKTAGCAAAGRPSGLGLQFPAEGLYDGGRHRDSFCRSLSSSSGDGGGRRQRLSGRAAFLMDALMARLGSMAGVRDAVDGLRLANVPAMMGTE